MTSPGSPADAKVELRIAQLVTRLRATEREIQALMGGEVDAVLDPEGGTFLLSGAQAALWQSEAAQRTLATTQTGILDALPAHIALLDHAGTIVTVNRAWLRFGAANGLRCGESCIGGNYLEVCDRAVGDHAEEATAAAAGIRRVLEASRTAFSLDYPCHSRAARRWFRLTVAPLDPESPGGVVVMHQDITERKFAEFAAEEAADVQAHLVAELALEHSRLLAAQSVAKVGSWETDLRTLAVLWSRETYHIFGLDPATFVLTHATFMAYCHPEDREAVDAAFQASVNTRAVCHITHRIVLADGGIKQVEERWRTTVDGFGTPATAIGTCQDISDSHAVAVVLQEKEALLRMAASITKVGAFRVLRAGGKRIWSDEVCAIYEVPPGSTPGLEEALSFYPPDDRSRMQKAFEACWQEGLPYDLELPIVTRKGRRGWIRTIGEAVRDQEGTVIAVQGAVQDITERRTAAEALRLSEERFRRTFDSAPMGIVITSTDGLFTQANTAFRRMVGYTSAELQGMAFVDLTHPDDRPATLAAVSLLLGARRENLVLEKRYIASDGRTIWARVSISAPRDLDGRPLYFITGVEDITHTRQAQEALAASEERFRLLSKAANDAIYDWDIRANTVWYNEGYGQQYGMEVGLLARSAEGWARLVHGDDRDRVWQKLRQALEGGAQTWSDEYRLRRGDGSYAHVLDRGYIVRDEGGLATRMIGAHTDLTGRKEAELHLAQQAALLDAAHDAIMVKGMDGTITYWNKGAERIFGWLAAEAVGRNAAELLELDPALRAEAHALLAKDGQWEGERIEVGKDGRSHDTAVRLSVLQDEAGAPTAILAIITDVTERKRLEMQSLRAQRLESLGTLAGGIAHDLNNVLAPILVSIELLRMDDLDPVRLESLATIEASAKRGAAMVQQVLTFARGAEGERRPLEVEKIAQDVEKIARDTFPKGITIQLTVTPDLWHVKGDATQVHQVLMNLLLNARDAMPGGGTLKIQLSNMFIDDVFARMDPNARVGPYVTLAVTDSGVGITPQVQQRLFEPFFSTKEVGKGTGLGLSTVHSIVHSHGGFIDLYSEVGQGARFTVYLPALPDGDVPVAEVLPKSQLPRGNGELILVVDDEPSIRNVVRRTLERFGYRVMEALNGAEGVAIYTEHLGAIDAVLTDMAMPVMDGPAMIAALRKLDPGVRIVASSGLTSGASLAHALAAGVTDFVTKPYTAETLLTILDTMLRRGGAPRQGR